MADIVEFTMPKLGEVMEEGKIIAWKKSVCEKVKSGDIIESYPATAGKM